MNKRLIMLAVALAAVLALIACSSSDSDDPANPTDPQNPGYESTFAALEFNDFGADARRVLPPVYQNNKADDFDMWRDGDYALLGKVFSEHEPMSIHANIDGHDEMMQELDMMIQMIVSYEEEHEELPTEPWEFEDPEYGSGTAEFHYLQPTAAIAVPAVCQTVFGRTEVAVEYVLQATYTMDAGMVYETPYFGFTLGEETETLYYWAVGMNEDGEPEGTQLFLAEKDIATEAVEIAGAYFKADGPGEEERCNWVYHMAGDSSMDFTYNMGWYAECPDFDLFGCVEGSGNKDVEFGLRYHEYTDTTGWTEYREDSVSEEIFGPVAGDPYGYIDPEERSGDFADYINAAIMYQRDDSPLDEIPNPFAELF